MGQMTMITVEAELHVSDFHPVKLQPAPVIPDHTATTKNNSDVNSNITVSTDPLPLTKSITTIGTNSSAQVNTTVESTEAPTTTGSQLGQYSSAHFLLNLCKEQRDLAKVIWCLNCSCSDANCSLIIISWSSCQNKSLNTQKQVCNAYCISHSFTISSKKRKLLFGNFVK